MSDDEKILEELAKQNTNSALDALDDFASVVETFSGFRAQFMSAGWSQEHAEEMVIQILKMGSKPKDG